MNKLNENQHFVSKVLLKRFKSAGNPLQCYQVQCGKWIPKSPNNACSSPGYNQFLKPDQAGVDNFLEADFSSVESRMPRVFSALEVASKRLKTELPKHTYKDLCKYCSFLKLIAPYAKPSAVAAFMIQLNMELKGGEDCLLRDLNVPKEIISFWRKEYELGNRVIVESDNALQLFYKFQFHRSYQIYCTYMEMAHWTIFNCPFDIPIPDIGLVPIAFPELKLNVYFLPIGPKLLLKGLIYFDTTKNSSAPIIKGETLAADEAEYVFDCICSSAISEIVCSKIDPGVPIAIERAKSKGVRFQKLTNVTDVLSAGLKSAADNCLYRVVSSEVYVKYIHSFIHRAS